MAAAAMGPDAAQPRGALHGGRGAARAANHGGAGTKRGRYARQSPRDTISRHQQGLGPPHRSPARRATGLLPAGAVGVIWRGRTVARDWLPQRRIIAADARAVT